ncbi:molybdenum cofactor cytidylyltransferase [Lutibacter sp. Hel_I_33_5]|uniref:nucleotidyltransferase family protein n=1 Tax=Lutibacter sp. Hel_I_33_5 TaxID=1566289 RepID=UPI00119D80B5|nr:nucleotidyltransferase family protein [Lutibacter sp. Hel_I_33_5]TVZ56008.1 molybdenum cofactor cytidylyltransferase [Lutibacter sp. Hel_I_33_5]
MNNIAILILAAGKSSRMGSVKQLLSYKNTTLLGWTIETVQKLKKEDIFCVLGAYAKNIEKEVSKYNIETIFNSKFETGLSSSIVNGIEYLKNRNYSSVLILLADQPKITSTYINVLIKKSIENPTKIIAANYSNHNGVPAIFPKPFFTELLKLKGDKGAKDLLKNTNQIISIPFKELSDIDTQEEYQKLIK